MSELGKLRVKKSYQVLNKTDIVLLVCSAVEGITEEEQKLLKQIEKKQIPCILVMNKADTIARFCPVSALIRLDFPAFRFPKMPI